MKPLRADLLMRIERIAVYTANLEYTGKAYAFAGGRSHQVFETTVVALSTDTGLEGYGEVCPCGPNYMAAFGQQVRRADTLPDHSGCVYGRRHTHDH